MVTNIGRLVMLSHHLWPEPLVFQYFVLKPRPRLSKCFTKTWGDGNSLNLPGTTIRGGQNLPPPLPIPIGKELMNLPKQFEDKYLTLRRY